MNNLKSKMLDMDSLREKQIVIVCVCVCVCVCVSLGVLGREVVQGIIKLETA